MEGNATFRILAKVPSRPSCIEDSVVCGNSDLGSEARRGVEFEMSSYFPFEYLLFLV